MTQTPELSTFELLKKSLVDQFIVVSTVKQVLTNLEERKDGSENETWQDLAQTFDFGTHDLLFEAGRLLKDHPEIGEHAPQLAMLVCDRINGSIEDAESDGYLSQVFVIEVYSDFRKALSDITTLSPRAKSLMVEDYLGQADDVIRLLEPETAAILAAGPSKSVSSDGLV